MSRSVTSESSSGRGRDDHHYRDGEFRRSDGDDNTEVAVTLLEDRRARVPFALVGVVLLLGSLVYANAVVVSGPGRQSHAADTALERSESAARTTTRVAAKRAARQAARNPVVRPANTATGRALNGSRPFRDALDLRIAVAVADALNQTRVTEGSVTARTRLRVAADANASENDSAMSKIRAVETRPIQNGTAFRLTVPVVSEAVRGDRVLATRTDQITVTIHLPVFAVHQRTQRYERLLGREPVAGAGLGRQLTARLVALAEVRGLAQYGGLGIENVVSNRHVEVAANDAALGIQRETFGRADPDGRAAVGRAGALVGVTDLLVTTASRHERLSWAGTVLTARHGAASKQWTLDSHDRATRTVEVGVNASVEAPYLHVSGDPLDRIVREAYRATVVRQVTVTDRERGREPTLDSPGPNWTLVATETRDRRRVTERDRRRTMRLRVFGVQTRRVQVTHVERRHWTNGSATRTTRATWADDYTVRVVHRGRYDPSLPGPSRSVRPVFASGGPLDGENLRDVPENARLPLRREQVDEMAKRAISDGKFTEQFTVAGERPADLRAWITRDLVRLRERVRNISVEVSQRKLTSGKASPASKLAATLRNRRASLLDTPRTYDGAADRARIAARATFLDRVIRALSERAAANTDRSHGLASEIESAAPLDSIDLQAATAAAADATAPQPRKIGSETAQSVVLVPDADPAYLTLTPVGPETAESVSRGTEVTPLAARNVNVFTVPYGDVGDTLTGGLTGDSRSVSYRTAGRALVSTNETLASDRLDSALDDESENAGSSNTGAESSLSELRDRRETLRRALVERTARIDRQLRVRLAEALTETLGEQVGRQRVRAIVATARDSYGGVGSTAVAATNGSYADRIALVAGQRLGLSGVERDRIALRLRVWLREQTATDRVSVPKTAVNETVSTRRQVVEYALSKGVTRASEAGLARARKRLAGEAFDAVLAGLPVAPVPGYWYATVNVWIVQVRGTYPSFAVTAHAGDRENASAIRYVRTDRNVTLDVDGDGTPETIGRNRAIRFQTHAVALAVVPAGRSGVGDIDGNADERSEGWNCPDGPVCGSQNRSEQNQSSATSSDSPVISDGRSSPSNERSVGAMSGRLPPSRTRNPPASPSAVSETNGTGLNV